MPRQNSNISQIQDMLLASFGRNRSIFQQLVSCAQAFYSPPSGFSICAGSVPGCGARRLWALVLESATYGSLVPDTGKGVEKIQATQGFMEWAYIATVRLKIEHP